MEACCKCKYWRLTRVHVNNGKKEVMIGVCRYAVPVNGWPETLENDLCSLFESTGPDAKSPNVLPDDDAPVTS